MTASASWSNSRDARPLGHQPASDQPAGTIDRQTRRWLYRSHPGPSAGIVSLLLGSNDHLLPPFTDVVGLRVTGGGEGHQAAEKADRKATLRHDGVQQPRQMLRIFAATVGFFPV